MLNGITWSNWISKLDPHATQRPPSRSNTASRTARGIGSRRSAGVGHVLREPRVRALEPALRAPLAIADEREHVARRQSVVLPEEAVLERPVGAPAVGHDRDGLVRLQGLQLAQAPASTTRRSTGPPPCVKRQRQPSSVRLLLTSAPFLTSRSTRPVYRRAQTR